MPNMGWSALAILTICIFSIGKSDAQMPRDIMGFNEMSDQFAQFFVDNIIESGVFGRSEDKDFTEIIDNLMRAIGMFTKLHNEPASQKKTLMTAFASELAELIVAECDDDALSVVEKSRAVTDALRHAYSEIGARPNHEFVNEVQMLVGVFLNVAEENADRDYDYEMTRRETRFSGAHTRPGGTQYNVHETQGGQRTVPQQQPTETIQYTQGGYVPGARYEISENKHTQETYTLYGQETHTGGNTPNVPQVQPPSKLATSPQLTQGVKAAGTNAAPHQAGLAQPPQPAPPAKPVQPPQPAKLVQPPQPAKPVQKPQPAKPAEPVQPARPAEPVQPAKAAQPVLPAKAAKPIEKPQPAKPVQPEKPVQPANPVQPAKPAEPVQPAKAAEPVQPAKTAEPVQPAIPVQSVQPAKAAEPVQPAKLAQPEQSAKVAEPVQPPQLVQKPAKPHKAPPIPPMSPHLPHRMAVYKMRGNQYNGQDLGDYAPNIEYAQRGTTPGIVFGADNKILKLILPEGAEYVHPQTVIGQVNELIAVLQEGGGKHKGSGPEYQIQQVMLPGLFGIGKGGPREVTIEGPRKQIIRIMRQSRSKGITPGIVTSSDRTIQTIVLPKKNPANQVFQVDGPEGEPVDIFLGASGSTPKVIRDNTGRITKVILPEFTEPGTITLMPPNLQTVHISPEDIKNLFGSDINTQMQQVLLQGSETSPQMGQQIISIGSDSSVSSAPKPEPIPAPQPVAPATKPVEPLPQPVEPTPPLQPVEPTPSPQPVEPTPPPQPLEPIAAPKPEKPVKTPEPSISKPSIDSSKEQTSINIMQKAGGSSPDTSSGPTNQIQQIMMDMDSHSGSGPKPKHEQTISIGSKSTNSVPQPVESAPIKKQKISVGTKSANSPGHQSVKPTPTPALKPAEKVVKPALKTVEPAPAPQPVAPTTTLNPKETQPSPAPISSEPSTDSSTKQTSINIMQEGGGSSPDTSSTPTNQIQQVMLDMDSDSKSKPSPMKKQTISIGKKSDSSVPQSPEPTPIPATQPAAPNPVQPLPKPVQPLPKPVQPLPKPVQPAPKPVETAPTPAPPSAEPMPVPLPEKSLPTPVSSTTIHSTESLIEQTLINIMQKGGNNLPDTSSHLTNQIQQIMMDMDSDTKQDNSEKKPEPVRSSPESSPKNKKPSKETSINIMQEESGSKPDNNNGPKNQMQQIMMSKDSGSQPAEQTIEISPVKGPNGQMIDLVPEAPGTTPGAITGKGGKVQKIIIPESVSPNQPATITGPHDQQITVMQESSITTPGLISGPNGEIKKVILPLQTSQSVAPIQPPTAKTPELTPQQPETVSYTTGILGDGLTPPMNQGSLSPVPEPAQPSLTSVPQPVEPTLIPAQEPVQPAPTPVQQISEPISSAEVSTSSHSSSINIVQEGPGSDKDDSSSPTNQIQQIMMSRPSDSGSESSIPTRMKARKPRNQIISIDESSAISPTRETPTNNIIEETPLPEQVTTPVNEPSLKHHHHHHHHHHNGVNIVQRGGGHKHSGTQIQQVMMPGDSESDIDYEQPRQQIISLHMGKRHQPAETKPIPAPQPIAPTPNPEPVTPSPIPKPVEAAPIIEPVEPSPIPSPKPVEPTPVPVPQPAISAPKPVEPTPVSSLQPIEPTPAPQPEVLVSTAESTNQQPTTESSTKETSINIMQKGGSSSPGTSSRPSNQIQQIMMSEPGSKPSKEESKPKEPKKPDQVVKPAEPLRETSPKPKKEEKKPSEKTSINIMQEGSDDKPGEKGPKNQIQQIMMTKDSGSQPAEQTIEISPVKGPNGQMIDLVPEAPGTTPGAITGKGGKVQKIIIPESVSPNHPATINGPQDQQITVIQESSIATPGLVSGPNNNIEKILLPIPMEPVPEQPGQVEPVPLIDGPDQTPAPQTPEPQPIPAPQPEPLPAPQPEPIPAPQLEPLPPPQPESIPAPQPELLPAPQPEPLPVPQPEPLPAPKHTESSPKHKKPSKETSINIMQKGSGSKPGDKKPDNQIQQIMMPETDSKPSKADSKPEIPEKPKEVGKPAEPLIESSPEPKKKEKEPSKKTSISIMQEGSDDKPGEKGPENQIQQIMMTKDTGSQPAEQTIEISPVKGPNDQMIDLVPEAPGTTPGVVTGKGGNVQKIIIPESVSPNQPATINGPQDQQITVMQESSITTPGIVSGPNNNIEKVLLPTPTAPVPEQPGVVEPVPLLGGPDPTPAPQVVESKPISAPQPEPLPAPKPSESSPKHKKPSKETSINIMQKGSGSKPGDKAPENQIQQIMMSEPSSKPSKEVKSKQERPLEPIHTPQPDQPEPVESSPKHKKPSKETSINIMQEGSGSKPGDKAPKNQIQQIMMSKPSSKPSKDAEPKPKPSEPTPLPQPAMPTPVPEPVEQAPVPVLTTGRKATGLKLPTKQGSAAPPLETITGQHGERLVPPTTGLYSMSPSPDSFRLPKMQYGYQMEPQMEYLPVQVSPGYEPMGLSPYQGLGLGQIENVFNAILRDGSSFIPSIIKILLKAKGTAPQTIDLRIIVNELQSIFSDLQMDHFYLSRSELFFELILEAFISALEIIRVADYQCIRNPPALGNSFKYVNALNDILF